MIFKKIRHYYFFNVYLCKTVDLTCLFDVDKIGIINKLKTFIDMSKYVFIFKFKFIELPEINC